MVDASATGSVLLGSAGVPAAGLGTADGLICGNRFEALPAGIVVETPGTPTIAGSVPIGMFVPTVLPDRPRIVVVDPLCVVLDGVAAPEPFDLELVEDGEVVGVFATVTVGAVAVAVRLAELPLATATVAVYLIVSPAGAVFGTVTSASISDADGCFCGRLRSQLVGVGLVEQLSTVNVGWP
jgi:hypothetical protein